MDESKIADIETRLMYQEQTLEELNAVITRQNLELSSLKKQLEKLQDQANLLMPLLHGKPSDEPPPPHY